MTWLCPICLQSGDAHIRSFDSLNQGYYYCPDLWRNIARPDQLPPGGDWSTWLLMVARGWGATRTAAEATHAFALENAGARLVLVAENLCVAREVMVRGNSGLLSLLNPPEFVSSRDEVRWPNGSSARLFSDHGRKPFGKAHWGWAEGLSKWHDLSLTWTLLRDVVTLGDSPRIVATTVPALKQFLRALAADPRTHVTSGSVDQNAKNLPVALLRSLEEQFGGTEIGRALLDGEMPEPL